MNNGTRNMMAALLVLIAASGCSTTSIEQPGYANDRPILSAAEARTMINVKVRELEPIPVEDTVVAAANQMLDLMVAE